MSEANSERVEILFRSDDLLVRAIRFGECSSAFVSFDAYSDVQSLERLCFGEAYFRHRGISAAYVASRTNNWYQLPEIEYALNHIRKWSSQFDRVISYGSSMGGYAALVLGATCGACCGFAISPQFSVDPKVVPFEDRWIPEVAKIKFRSRQDHPYLPVQYIAFDPHMVADARHAALFGGCSETMFIRAPYGGHPVGAFLNEAGVLGAILDQLAIENISIFQTQIYEEQLRQGRRRSGQYLAALASLIPPWRPRQRAEVARLAAEANVQDPGYRSLYASMLDDLERYDDAYIQHCEAMALPTAGPYDACRMARHLMLRGRLSDARELADGLVGAYPELLVPALTLNNVRMAKWRQRLPAWLVSHLRFEPVFAFVFRRAWTLARRYRGWRIRRKSLS